MELLQEVSDTLDQFFGDELIPTYTANCELLIGSLGVSMDDESSASPSVSY